MNASTFLAIRYFFNKNQESFIFLVGQLAFFGVFTATFALTLALMVTTGFEKMMQDNLQGLNSDIIVMANLDKKNTITNIRKKLEMVKKANLVEVDCSVKVDQVILKEGETFFPVVFYGVDERTYSQVNNVKKKIKNILEKKTLEFIFLKKMVVLGSKLAQKLNLSIGQEFLAQIPTIKGKRVLLRDQKLKVGAIIETGLEDYDNNVIIAGNQFFNSLFGFKNIDFFMIKQQNNKEKYVFSLNMVKTFFLDVIYKFGNLLCLNVPDPEKEKFIQIKKIFNNQTVLHWSEISPAIISSMKFERFVISLILLLLLLLGLTNVSSMIFVKIISKKKDIAVFFSLGMNASEISMIFVKFGCIITLIASTLGIAFANFIAYLIVRFDFIKLPSEYFVQSLPINFDVNIYLLVFFVTNLLVFLITKWPTKKISQLNISQIIRS